MTTLYEGAFAKLNLTLDVLDKRPDGYHDIKSVMQTISLRDDIQIDLGTEKPWCIVCDKEGVPTDESNLCWKAAKLFFETVKKDPDGLTITITKRIPMQAGLGSGSADAAAVLRALEALLPSGMTSAEMTLLAKSIGADVPFVLRGGCALAEGIGEVLREHNPDITIWAVEPEHAAILSGGSIGTHIQMGIGDGIIPEILNQNIYDDICIVKDDEAIRTSKELASKEGIMCGISSGTNVAAAIRLAKKLGRGKTVVTVLPDTAERYFSTPLFE